MDLGYFERQQLWEDTEITTFKENPKRKVLVITDCGLSMVDCKWAKASVNMEKGILLPWTKHENTDDIDKLQ